MIAFFILISLFCKSIGCYNTIALVWYNNLISLQHYRLLVSSFNLYKTKQRNILVPCIVLCETRMSDKYNVTKHNILTLLNVMLYS
jgi:hypothetical protein